MPGRRARVWEVCLPASSSSFPNSRNRQGRLQLRGERESKQAVPAGAGEGEEGRTRTRAGGRRDPDEARKLGTDPPTLTHSHTVGQVSTCHPPCRGHPDTLSQSCQFPEHSRTHTEMQALPPTTLPSPTNPCGLQTAAGGWKEEQQEERQEASERMCSQSPGSLGISCHTSFPKTQ